MGLFLHYCVAVSYVPTGQDATVNYPNIDFKFKNDTIRDGSGNET